MGGMSQIASDNLASRKRGSSSGTAARTTAAVAAGVRAAIARKAGATGFELHDTTA